MLYRDFMEEIEKFFKKVNGSIFVFLGLAISVFTIIIAVALYTSTGTSYSIFTHYISDLGAVYSAPNNAYMVFTIGMVLQALVQPFTALFLFYFLRKKGTDKKLTNVWLACSLLAFIGTIMAGVFPEDTWKHYHFYGAFLVFFFGMMSHGFFGLAAISTPTITNKHAFPGLLVATINTIFMFLYISNVPQSAVTFFEWMSLFSGWIFSIDIGIYTLRTQY